MFSAGRLIKQQRLCQNATKIGEVKQLCWYCTLLYKKHLSILRKPAFCISALCCQKNTTQRLAPHRVDATSVYFAANSAVPHRRKTTSRQERNLPARNQNARSGGKEGSVRLEWAASGLELGCGTADGASAV